MCKTYSISYTCTHLYTTRLSTCHGAFTTQPKPNKPPKTACSSQSCLIVQSAQACGDCQRQPAEQTLESTIAAGGQGPEAREFYDRAVYKLQRAYPTCRRYQRCAARPGKNGSGREKGRGSLLRTEVLPEEVVVKWKPAKTVTGGGWDTTSWGDNWTSLSDELAEIGEEPTSLDLPMTGSMNESLDEYMSAFTEVAPEDGEEEEQQTSEWPEETAWASDWSGEPDLAPEQDRTWPLQETATTCAPQQQILDTDWTPEPEQASAEPVTAMPAGSGVIFEAPEQQQLFRENDTVVAASVNRCTKPPQTERKVATLTLPSRRKPPPPSPRRRFTFDGNEKKEIELRERLRCVWLPMVISVGGS